VFFEKTPFLTFEWLGALFVVAPLDGIAHRRHDGKVLVVVAVVLLFFLLYFLVFFVGGDVREVGCTVDSTALDIRIRKGSESWARELL
jgi:hypothetical protein